MSDLLDALNKEQRLAVENFEGYVRLHAGAGTGKTRTLTYRYAYLVSALGIPPKSVWCCTFTNKAANEMKERIISLCGPDIGEPFVSTFHGFCLNFLKEEIMAIGWPKNFSIWNVSQVQSALRPIYSECQIDGRKFSLRKACEYIDEVKNSVEFAGDDYIADLIEPDTSLLLAKSDAALNPGNKIFLRYLFAQRNSYALDFDDLILITLYILIKNPEVRARWQERLEFIMVDEFQDIDRYQYALVEILAGKHHNLFIVGDPDQTIYSWRGARVSFFNEFIARHGGASHMIDPLDTEDAVIHLEKELLRKDEIDQYYFDIDYPGFRYTTKPDSNNQKARKRRIHPLQAQRYQRPHPQDLRSPQGRDDYYRQGYSDYDYDPRDRDPRDRMGFDQRPLQRDAYSDYPDRRSGDYYSPYERDRRDYQDHRAYHSAQDYPRDADYQRDSRYRDSYQQGFNRYGEPLGSSRPYDAPHADPRSFDRRNRDDYQRYDRDYESDRRYYDDRYPYDDSQRDMRRPMDDRCLDDRRHKYPPYEEDRRHLHDSRGAYNSYDLRQPQSDRSREHYDQSDRLTQRPRHDADAQLSAEQQERSQHNEGSSLVSAAGHTLANSKDRDTQIPQSQGFDGGTATFKAALTSSLDEHLDDDARTNSDAFTDLDSDARNQRANTPAMGKSRLKQDKETGLEPSAGADTYLEAQDDLRAEGGSDLPAINSRAKKSSLRKVDDESGEHSDEHSSSTDSLKKYLQSKFDQSEVNDLSVGQHGRAYQYDYTSDKTSDQNALNGMLKRGLKDSLSDSVADRADQPVKGRRGRKPRAVANASKESSSDDETGLSVSRADDDTSKDSSAYYDGDDLRASSADADTSKDSRAYYDDDDLRASSADAGASEDSRAYYDGDDLRASSADAGTSEDSRAYYDDDDLRASRADAHTSKDSSAYDSGISVSHIDDDIPEDIRAYYDGTNLSAARADVDTSKDSSVYNESEQSATGAGADTVEDALADRVDIALADKADADIAGKAGKANKTGKTVNGTKADKSDKGDAANVGKAKKAGKAGTSQADKADNADLDDQAELASVTPDNHADHDEATDSKDTKSKKAKGKKKKGKTKSYDSFLGRQNALRYLKAQENYAVVDLTPYVATDDILGSKDDDDYSDEVDLMPPYDEEEYSDVIAESYANATDDAGALLEPPSDFDDYVPEYDPVFDPDTELEFNDGVPTLVHIQRYIDSLGEVSLSEHSKGQEPIEVTRPQSQEDIKSQTRSASINLASSTQQVQRDVQSEQYYYDAQHMALQEGVDAQKTALSQNYGALQDGQAENHAKAEKVASLAEKASLETTRPELAITKGESKDVLDLFDKLDNSFDPNSINSNDSSDGKQIPQSELPPIVIRDYYESLPKKVTLNITPMPKGEERTYTSTFREFSLSKQKPINAELSCWLENTKQSIARVAPLISALEFSDDGVAEGDAAGRASKNTGSKPKKGKIMDIDERAQANLLAKRAGSKKGRN